MSNKNIITIKLKNGTDIVGPVVEDEKGHVSIIHPVEIQIDPEFGFFARSYLLLAKGNVAHFNKSDLYLLAPASDKAVKYYQEFMHRINEPEEYEDDSDSDEEMEALLDSRNSTIH